MAPILTDVSESADARMLLRHCKFEARGCGASLSELTEQQPSLCAERFFAARFDGNADVFLCPNFVSSALINWSQQCSYLVAFVFSVVCAIAIVLQAGSLSQAEAALALSYAFALPYFLMFYGFIISNIKVALTALERLMELLEVPHEPAWRLPADQPGWPTVGSIEFIGASLRYGSPLACPLLPYAVEKMSISIGGGERVGICGRTGAGKSSLVVLLFRLVDACEGSIKVGGVDITQVGLQTLRQRMAVIPQNPLLMEGSIRFNLDPFGEHSGDKLLEILQLLGLPAGITLETTLGGGGRGDSELSAGQRQLLNLGRTMLRDVSILVMGEPTSNIDAQTDARIQASLIRDQMKGVTVLTIAHRLNTIVDYDRVLLMEAGQLAEVGKPAELLASEGSYFCKMAKELGADELAALRARAAAGGGGLRSKAYGK